MGQAEEGIRATAAQKSAVGTCWSRMPQALHLGRIPQDAAEDWETAQPLPISSSPGTARAQCASSLSKGYQGQD